MRDKPIHADQLIVGLLFLAIALTWAAQGAGWVEYDNLEVIVPVALIAAGLGGLGAFVANRVRARSQAYRNPVDVAGSTDLS